MSTTSISRIQHRRGTRENLPTLAQAELGYVTNERKLYIGHGDENIEILTERNIGDEYENVNKVSTPLQVEDITLSSNGDIDQIIIPTGKSIFIKYKIMNDTPVEGMQAGFVIAINRNDDRTYTSVTMTGTTNISGNIVNFAKSDSDAKKIKVSIPTGNTYTMTYTVEEL